jgi:cadmium resistance protein CadD (predicted permease)
VAIVEVVGIGIVAFVATNIDDLFILMVFFIRRSFPTHQIVLGQYVGMGLLLGISLAGSFVSLVIPHNLIGLIGLIPIAVGIKELLDLRKKDDENNDIDYETVTKKLSRNGWTAYLPFLTVAVITFSGGEEIGIYTSIFATYNGLSDIISIISVVMVLTGAWCTMAMYLVNHTFLATHFRHITDRVLPFVLIGLNIHFVRSVPLSPIMSTVVREDPVRMSLHL